MWLQAWLHSIHAVLLIQLVQSYLTRVVPMECLMRLWDRYVCGETGFGLHPYVCLGPLHVACRLRSDLPAALLHKFKEDLEELEEESLLAFLLCLPRFDVNEVPPPHTHTRNTPTAAVQVLVSADNIRTDAARIL